MLLNFSRISFAVLILSSLLFFNSCTSKISEVSKHNRFVKNFNIHIVNDSIKLHLISPADINYLTNPKSIHQSLKQFKLKTRNDVLLLGTTKTPNYQFLVTVGQKKEEIKANQYILDTIVNQHRLHLIGNYQNEADSQIVIADIKQIYSRLKSGKNYLDDMSSVMDIVSKAMSNNQFFKTLTEIQQFKPQENQRNSLEIQMQLTYSSFLGENEFYKKLIKEQEQYFKPNDSIIAVIDNNKLGNELALDEITKLAKNTNMLMINENHYYPNHRLLILELLPELKEIGYTHLALEALANPADSVLNLPNSHPTLKTGFYTMEQNYGNLIREAKKLGFEFVAYENTDPKKDREIGQVENLYHKTIGENKDAKVLVIAGIDHILEQPTASGKKWMATLMKELYQIDPLTISQTHLNLYRTYSKFNYQLLAKEEFAAIKPIAAVDYFVLNNQNMPANLWNNTYKYQNKYAQPVQISLFYGKEMNKAFEYQFNIPYFSVILGEKKTQLLPYHTKEETLMVVYNQLGTVLEKTKIN